MEFICSWGDENSKPAVLDDIADLDRLFDKVMKSKASGLPALFVIRTRGFELSFPIGTKAGFLQIANESGLPPYRMAVGTPGEQGFQTFMLEGVHDTEIPRRYVLPADMVKSIVREFILTGKRAAQVQWEDI